MQGLQNADGVKPWDPRKLEAWASGPVPGLGARHAARFMLGLWDPDREWECGKFNLFRALGTWDEEHRNAFLKWVLDPWRP